MKATQKRFLQALGAFVFRGVGEGGGRNICNLSPWCPYAWHRFSDTVRPDFGRGCDEALKKRIFSEKGGGNSVNLGFGKDLYRKGDSVKRFGPFTEPPDSES